MSAPLFVVGLGPGHVCLLAPEASAALDRARVLVGYKGYIERIPETWRAGRRVIATGMTGEIARAKAAIDAALAGEPTALVCSGDPGVYALSGLVLEIMEQQGLCATDLPLHIVPGIPAVCAAAALLGAPLMHDFACVSLSDLLTPWPLILKRLESAFMGDFVLALYNPRSKRRTQQLEQALALALQYKSPCTPVGVVKNAYRPGQEVWISPLGELRPDSVDMFTILIMGNSASRIVPGRGEAPLAWESGARMLTPRGYQEKYGARLT
ncbi:MAG: precorrin-3B C(17)-methyltransferase [Desulfovibrionaceae bacterium]|nr:precorrin-3B C(17)-methyltransferase [Desulfovibrionaceae bacterium]